MGQAKDAGYFKVLGSSIGLGRKLNWPDDFFVFYSELGYQRYMLKDYPSSFLVEDGTSQIIELNLSLSRSSQDQMIYPRRGSSFTLSLKLTPPYSLFKKKEFWLLSSNEKQNIRDDIASGDLENTTFEDEEVNRENTKKFKFIEYHKWTFNGSWYTNLFKELVLASKAEFGFLGFYNADIGASPFEKFDVGGSGMMGYNLYGTDIVALRGYAEGSLTPQTIHNNQRINNGNMYVKYTLEFRYPFTLNPSATIYGLAFLEGGNAWSKFQEFDPFSIKRSAGIGLRAFLPMFGMLGLDWGYGFDMPNSSLNADDVLNRRHGPEFHFTMGQQF
jgi:outer membrane protein insertion porin family